MNYDDLAKKFPLQNVIDGYALMVTPKEMWRLMGVTLAGCRMYLLVSRGSLKVEIDGSLHALAANTFVDMMGKTEFRFVDMTSDCVAHAVVPTMRFVEESLKNFRVGDAKYLWKNLNFPVQAFSDEEREMLLRPLEMLADVFARLDHGYRLEMAELYFRSFQVELSDVIIKCGSSADVRGIPFDRQDALALDFMKLVWRDFHVEHQADYYAKRLGISVKHLSRIVKERLEATPHEVIVQALAQQAASMLERETDLSVQQIAEALNFSDQASFCKFFKRQMGVSPKDYRNRRRGA